MSNKTIQLLEGSEKGFRWAITMEIYPTSGFKAKGRIRQWFDKDYKWNAFNEYGRKRRLRHNDRQWFIYHLGKTYMKDKEVHHEWENKARCLLLSPLAHRRKHYALFKP